MSDESPTPPAPKPRIDTGTFEIFAETWERHWKTLLALLALVGAIVSAGWGANVYLATSYASRMEVQTIRLDVVEVHGQVTEMQTSGRVRDQAVADIKETVDFIKVQQVRAIEQQLEMARTLGAPIVAEDLSRSPATKRRR